MTTSTSSADAPALLSNYNHSFLPLDPELLETLRGDNWEEIGRTCRIALVGNRLCPEDGAAVMGQFLDHDPLLLFNMLEDRERHRKALQRVLVLLRAAASRDSVALSQALSARGH